ncbi:MAG: HypC/HybG/HupF family hydrogenase formation chaperone, partial [Euryarchaeota archaeon]|nr:HypC/HybG/HupF family hydrogenase formation chaperone [Euryarchaeota archaeon]
MLRTYFTEKVKCLFPTVVIMCLAVPAEVREINGHEALVDYGGGVTRRV